MTIELWNHGTIEPLNEKSQIAQEYGLLLPADVRQQKARYSVKMVAEKKFYSLATKLSTFGTLQFM